MSYNDHNPQRAARRHRPAIWAIAVALGLAALAAIFFLPVGGRKDTGDVKVVAPGAAVPAPAAPTTMPATGAAPAGGAPVSN